MVPGRVVVEGDSMRPALEPGDRLLVLPWLRPRPGTVVAAADPRDPARTIVKRVAAVDGDGCAVLLGDAPHASTDSRTFGPVPPDLVRGRAVWRYFPPARRGRVSRTRTGTVWAMDDSRLARVLDSAFVADLPSLPMAELRSRRADGDELEAGVSMLRRIAQGRLDIVAAEQRRRREGGEPAGVDDLSEILADRGRPPGPGRLPRVMAPSADEFDTSELDHLAPPSVMSGISEASDDDLAALVERLSGYEADVSRRRQALFAVVDALQSEITRRYKTGEATVETLLQ